MRRFYLHRRNGTYYCQLFDPDTGKRLSARSLHTSDRDEAAARVAEWFRDGVPASRPGGSARSVKELLKLEAVLSAIRDPAFTAADGERVLNVLRERGIVERFVLRGSPGAVTVRDYLAEFWNEDSSDYLRTERARGRTIGRRHTREMLRIAARYWTETLGVLPLGQVRRKDIQAEMVRLSELNLAPATIAKALACLQPAFRWAKETGMISDNPCEGVRRIVGHARERGILTDAELDELARHEWPDLRIRACFLIGMTTGLRRGEIQALQVRDIEGDRLHVRHGWSDDDRLKTPKNGRERVAVLLPAVRNALLELQAANPYGSSPESFLVYGGLPDRPLDGNAILNGFMAALVALAVAKDSALTQEAALAALRERGISFHSLRHGYAKKMAARLEMQTAMRSTGHLSESMLRHYSNHADENDFLEIAEAAADAFGRIVPFSRIA